MCFDASEFFEQLVVLQNFEILNVEVGFVVSLELFTGLPRIDTFENAESSEVLQTDLQVANGIWTRFVLRGLAFDACFYFSYHLF